MSVECDRTHINSPPILLPTPIQPSRRLQEDEPLNQSDMNSILLDVDGVLEEVTSWVDGSMVVLPFRQRRVREERGSVAGGETSDRVCWVEFFRRRRRGVGGRRNER